VPILDKVAVAQLNQADRREDLPPDPGSGNADPTPLTMPLTRIEEGIKIGAATLTPTSWLNFFYS
jgi:hypothetical protein